MPALLIVCITIVPLDAQNRDETQRADERRRLEGEAVIALADAALGGRSVPSDFHVDWQNEFLKARSGTFVPFTLTIDADTFSRPAALVYVRAIRRQPPAPPFRGERTPPARLRRDAPPDEAFAVDAIFPVELALEPGRVARVRRGVTLDAGTYDVFVVVRERERVAGTAAAQPRSAVLRKVLEVPDYGSPGLTTSSVIVADRLDVLTSPIGPEELAERPYVIGQNDIIPAIDRKFRKNEELIVVFLVYNPFVTTERKFDLQVEYHFFRKGGPGGDAGVPAPQEPRAREGERYFNHTVPQRFNPGLLGGAVDPREGAPVLAGQGVPLSGFDDGEYRLAIRVVDLLAGTSVVREVYFSVGS